MAKYKFTLEKTPSKKGNCPQCGAKNAFRYYAGISRDFGICDRGNNCGYHNKPGAEQRPDKKAIEEMVKKEKEIKTIFPEQIFISEIVTNQKSNFHKFCIDKLNISQEHLTKWLCGSVGNKTAFVYMNKEKYLNVVHILYKADGHRDKQITPYSLKAKPGTKYGLCLFGEHLLTQDKIICLVESEKTAIIAAYFYPQFDWMATGGSNKLTDEKINVLFGRKIYYLCDADKAGRNSSTLKKLKAYEQNYSVIDMFPEAEDGSDIADAIIKGLLPEIKEPVQASAISEDENEKSPETLVISETKKSKNISDFEKVENFLSDRYEIRFNEVSNEIEFRKINSKEPFEVLNENNIYIELQKNFINFSQAKVTALLRSDYVTVYNPFNDYFENLAPYEETEPDYIQEITKYLPIKPEDKVRFEVQYKKMLVRCIACSLIPGVFNKQSFILVHDQQNSGKSTFVRWHCPPALSDYITENISTDKDSLICLSDNFIINMDELATLNKAEINTLKAMMSKDVVKVRRPYDKKPILTPRRANFFGSTNKTEFLSDETGSVRWICFELTGQLNFAYKQNIDINNIWKQAYSLFKSGFRYELTPEEIRENEKANSSYQIISEEQELIQKTLSPSTKEHAQEFMASSDIKAYLTEKFPFCRLNIINIGKALKILGFKKESHRKEYIEYPIKGYFLNKTLVDYNSIPKNKESPHKITTKKEELPY
jgi:Zn ribbon nucleic-acid-binding protein